MCARTVVVARPCCGNGDGARPVFSRRLYTRRASFRQIPQRVLSFQHYGCELGRRAASEEPVAPRQRRVGRVLGGECAQEPPPVPPIIVHRRHPRPEDPADRRPDRGVEPRAARDGPDALRYGGHQGVPELREWLAQHYSARDGMPLTADNFTITNGISGAIINVCDTFLDEGDVGLSESRRSPAARARSGSAWPTSSACRSTTTGMIPDALEETIEKLKGEGRRVKLLYTIPNFQNPTGSCLTLERRKAVVEICQRHSVMIMEDDAYGDVRFEADVPPSLFAIAGGKGVVFMGTFSKTVATGLRIGWVMADAPVTAALLHTRFDLGVSPWVQLTMLEFAKDGNWEKHVEKMSDVLPSQARRDAVGAAGALREVRELERAEGRLLPLADARGELDPKALAEAAREIGVQYVGGAGFHRGEGGTQQVRLAFSYTDESEIPEGIMRLGRALEEATRK